MHRPGINPRLLCHQIPKFITYATANLAFSPSIKCNSPIGFFDHFPQRRVDHFPPRPFPLVAAASDRSEDHGVLAAGPSPEPPPILMVVLFVPHSLVTAWNSLST